KQALADVRTAAAKTPTSATLRSVAGKLPGTVHLELLGTATAESGHERSAVSAALAGDSFSRGTSDGGTVVAAIPYQGEARVALRRQPATAKAIDTVNGEALRAGVIAGVIGVIVGLLLAQLIALRLRRLSAATEAIAHGDFETPLRYRFRDEFGTL